jgi:phosphoribosylaminoimidazole-succinocarboxamide synthase
MDMDNVYLGRDGGPPGMERIATGKVRDIFAVGTDRLLFVTTDRVSAFDVIMKEGVPGKGRVLTAISAHWFERTREVIPNHLISTRVEDVPGLDDSWRDRLRGRVMLVNRAQPSTVEWVERGCIAGSGWKEYQKSGTVCGIPLPAGLQLAQELTQAILTPTTKDEDHDRPLTPEQARERIGSELYTRLEKASLELFALGKRELDGIGILLADTKFEFGMLDGQPILIDEALTPDSSRFWARETWRPGVSPPSFDKQILRDWLETLDWNKEYPPPPVDPAVLARVSERYLEICQRITGGVPEGVAV